MKIALKILGTILITILTGFIYIIGPAIASSSHNISMTARESAMDNSKLALIFGPILIIAIWLPWNQIFQKKDN